MTTILQYSCLENSMARGAWQATVHGVAQSPVGHTHTHTHIRISLCLGEPLLWKGKHIYHPEFQEDML